MPKLEWWEDEDWWNINGGSAKGRPLIDKYDLIKKATVAAQSGIIGNGASSGVFGTGGAGGSGAFGATPASNSPSQFPSPYDIAEILRVKEEIKNMISTQHIPKNSVISGGVFVSLFNKQPINDIDVFVVKSNDNDIITLPGIESGRYSTVSKPENYTGCDDIIAIFNDKNTKFQYIYTRVTTPKELLENFDYLHCCCAYYDDKLWINQRIYDAITTKTLIPNNISNEREVRKLKFIKQGFKKQKD